MNTALKTRTGSTRPPRRIPATEPDRKRYGLLIALVLAIGALVAIVAFATGDDPDQPDTGASPDAAPLELALPGSDLMASCLPLEAELMSTMSPAFAATAVAVEGELVTLDVDRWYAGDGPDTVVLRAQHGAEALIQGFDFELGGQYLITAAEGTVNFCGYSGPATPELQAVFDQAFAG